MRLTGNRVGPSNGFVSESLVSPSPFPFLPLHDQRCSTIPMQNLTAPGDWNRQNSALKHFNWSEGCFKFHFIDADTTDGGPSEWEDYQGASSFGAEDSSRVTLPSVPVSLSSGAQRAEEVCA